MTETQTVKKKPASSRQNTTQKRKLTKNLTKWKTQSSRNRIK